MLARTTLITLGVTALLFGALLLALPTPGAPMANVVSGGNSDGNSWIIQNVRVFDGEQLTTPATLVIANGRIAATQAEAPEDAAIIDGRGLVAIPGLIDAHTHSYGPARRDALRFGVSSMLDMFTSPSLLQDHDQRAAFDPSSEAALFSAGMLATVERGHGTQYGIAIDVLRSPSAAPDWVRRRKLEGSDYIKLVFMPDNPRLPSLDLETASAVIAAAKAEQMLAVAHISTHRDAEALVDAGVDGLVHIFADRKVSDTLLRKMQQANVFVIPTLAVIAMADGRKPGQQIIADEDLSTHLDTMQRNNLATDFGGRIPGFSLDTAFHNVAAMQAAGIDILAGSDAPNPGTAHGATLHQELALLVEAGLSDAAALQAATTLPAKRFSLEGRGLLSVGARADVVLLDDDPLIDIAKTRRIHHVFRNGYAVARTVADNLPDGQAVPADLGRFDASPIDAPDGFAWTTTSDEMMGGKSTAALTQSSAVGTLVIDATVTGDFPYPWSGAYFGVTEQARIASLAGFATISFDVKGTPAEYRLMMFSAEAYGAPPTQTFTVGEQWQTISLPLNGFSGFDAGRFTGMAFATPMTPGPYRFEIDNVMLERAPMDD